MTLEEALAKLNVLEVNEFDNAPGPFTGWLAVENETGIIAYFANEQDAFRFRLAEVNRLLNG